jgi:hypothetical protein
MTDRQILMEALDGVTLFEDECFEGLGDRLSDYMSSKIAAKGKSAAKSYKAMLANSKPRPKLSGSSSWGSI